MRFDVSDASNPQNAGPTIGLEGGRFEYREAGLGPVFNSSIASLGAGATGDWFRLQMVMNFAPENDNKSANDNGSLSVFYQNLTRADVSFAAIDFWPNRDLGLTDNGSAVTPSDRDSLLLRQDLVGIILGENDRVAHNLVFQPVPVPGALGLPATGLISLTGVFSRHRGQAATGGRAG